MRRGIRMWLSVGMIGVGGLLSDCAFAELNLAVIPADGRRHVDLGVLESVAKDAAPRPFVYEREIRLVIEHTGPGRYVVSQIFHAPPRGSNGEAFELSRIRTHARIRDGRGNIRLLSPTPAAAGEQEIFVSDDDGSAAELVVNYEIQVPPFQTAGQYETQISYRVKTL